MNFGLRKKKRVGIMVLPPTSLSKLLKLISPQFLNLQNRQNNAQLTWLRRLRKVMCTNNFLHQTSVSLLLK